MFKKLIFKNIKSKKHSNAFNHYNKISNFMVPLNHTCIKCFSNLKVYFVMIYCMTLVQITTLFFKNNNNKINVKKMRITGHQYSFNINLNVKSSTYLCNLNVLQIQKRTMMHGRSFYVARAAYHSLSALTNNTVIGHTNKNDQNKIIESLVDLGLDHSQGVIQHKSAFIRHVINHKFNGQIVYEIFTNKTNVPVTCVSGNTDARVINELPVIQAYHNTFQHKIINIQANLDNQQGNFYAQKQTNQDFWVSIKTAVDNATKPYIVRPQDEKSGTSMFKHATRGTIGMLTYDSQTEQNVQIMSDNISIQNLIEKDKEHLASVIKGLQHDNIYVERIHDPLKDQAENILKNSGSSFVDQQQSHNIYQKFMWEHFQNNYNYPRSISFIFPITVNYNNVTEQNSRYCHFKNKFISLLGDRIYDLNRRGDCKEISVAMIVAYKDAVDPQILDKLQHLQHDAGITFNTKFLDDLAYMIKEGLL